LVKVTYVITDACVDVMDRTCISECPVDCIYEGSRSLYINPDECIDCGACEVVCPVTAIVADFDIENAAQAASLQRARETFAHLGPLSGAKGFGHLVGDHPDIASMSVRQA
jgi:NAD-dependent dihydropyrimidine dehydrogenase PreA subunit